MERRPLKGGRLIEGGYDQADRILEIVFADLSVRRFSAVPLEVWKRLQAAPNAAVYYEDRIQDEYPWSQAPKLSARPASASAAADDRTASAKARLDALFGKPDEPA